MKPSDIRVDNFVLAPRSVDSKTLVESKVIGFTPMTGNILLSQYVHLLNGSSAPASRVQGILIDGFWLEKLGFEWSIELESWSILMGEYLIYFQDFSHCTIENVGRSVARVAVDINYVHQLQNLCYSLTGENLKTPED